MYMCDADDTIYGPYVDWSSCRHQPHLRQSKCQHAVDKCVRQAACWCWYLGKPTHFSLSFLWQLLFSAGHLSNNREGRDVEQSSVSEMDKATNSEECSIHTKTAGWMAAGPATHSANRFVGQVSCRRVCLGRSSTQPAVVGP
jgi:hypothetical protein